MTSNSGNVLFIILVAVALFAALSYAVTSSSRGGGSGISKEKAMSYVAQLENIAVAHRLAVQRMTMRGVPLDNIDCVNDILVTNSGSPTCKYGSPSSHNPNCSSPDCQIYDPAGGGVPPQVLSGEIFTEPPTYGSGNTKLGHSTKFVGVKVPDLGTDKDDRVLAFYYVRKEVCLALNDKVGILNPGGEPPTDPGCCGSPYFQDEATTGNQMSNPLLAGKMEFCVSRAGETDWNNRIVFVLGVR